MENYISYVAGGERQKISTTLAFHNSTDKDSVARRLYLEVAFDRDDKLINGTIRRKPTEQETKEMREDEIFEWYRISNIEFFDYGSMQKMSMKHLSDYQGTYTIEKLESTINNKPIK